MGQRFVVNGINNDKIELVSNYDVRKLNRLLDAKDQMWLTKVKMAREEMAKDFDEDADKYSYDSDPYNTFHHGIKLCLDIMDKLIAEVKTSK